MNYHVDPDVVLGLVVGAMSLFFDYFPGVSAKFDELSREKKRLITVMLAILVAVLFFIGQCYGLFQTDLVCAPKSMLDLGYSIIVAVAVMYGFHKATKPQPKVFG